MPLENPHSPQEEIRWLRAGEEEDHIEGAVPTPGQFLKRLHDLDEKRRIEHLGRFLMSAQIAHNCTMSMHEANLEELRQRAMESWSTLSRIANLCYSPHGQDHEDRMIRASDIIELLPKGLQRG